jgi:hypothetical protein
MIMGVRRKMAKKNNNEEVSSAELSSAVSISEGSSIFGDDHREMMKIFMDNPDIASSRLLVRNDKPLRLAVHQRLIIKGLWNHQFNLLILTRGGGKTFLLGLYCVLKAMLYPREKAVVASSSYRQAQFTFDEIIKFYEESPLLRQSTTKAPTKGPNACEMHLENGSKIIAYPLGDGKPCGYLGLVV